MPKIIIRDEDLTTAVGSITNSYGVFVPGLAGADAPANRPKAAVEFTSLSKFKDVFGTQPQKLKNEANNEYDYGFVYACELLGAGLPVTYREIEVPTELTVTDTWESPGAVSGTSTLTSTPIANTTFDCKDQNGGTLEMTTFEVGEGNVITFTFDQPTPAPETPLYLASVTYRTSAPTISEMTVTDVCKLINGDTYAGLDDKGMYDISFVTSGGYPTIYQDDDHTSSLVSLLTDVCASRGDCFALIDIDKEIKIHTLDDVPTALPTGIADAFTVTPWVVVTLNYIGDPDIKEAIMPGSFAYLKAFATSIKTNNSWFATAGVKRGNVACNGVTEVITNAEADALQPEQGGNSINAITFIKPYGYVIWGNRTLNTNQTGLVANSFINVRQLVHDIKRQLYIVARGLMFDPNDDILWVNFKNAITPTLEKMRSGQGISSFRLVRIANNKRGTLTAKIIIAPIEAVETFELTVELTDADMTVTG